MHRSNRQILRLQRFLSLLSLLLTAVFTIPAQYRFDRWTTDEGLPQNSVNGIIQSRDGYIWAVTRGGIVRFDGVRFKVFNRSNTRGLDESRFTALVEDKAGRIWFLSDSLSIVKYENGAFETFSDGKGFAGKFRGYFLLTDIDGNLIFGTDLGHFQYQNGAFVKFEVPTSSADSLLCYRDRQGGIWLIDQTGLRRVSNSGVQYFDVPKTVLQYIPLIYDDRFGNFWMTFGENKTYRVHWGKIQAVPVKHDGWTFAEDSEGNLWFGVSGGLYKIQADQVDAETIDLSKFSKIAVSGLEEPISLTIDGEGGVWTGMNSGGLTHITRQPIEMLPKSDWRIKGDNVYPILEDRAGNVWVGTWTNALIRYDKNNQSKIYQPPPSGNLITSLFEDGQNRLWIASVNGVGYMENEKFTRFDRFNPDVDNGFTMAMTEDDAGAMWFATEKQGLYRFDGEKLTNFTTADGLPNNETAALLKTKDRLWIGTKSGLAFYQNEKIFRFDEKDFNRDQIRSIYEDADGTIWIGTYDAGLIRFKNGEFRRISQKDGMFNGNVFCTLEDDNGWFWINSNNGIYRVRKQQLNDFADGKSPRVESIAYNKKDGLLNIEGNGGKQPAGIRRSNGELWFPTQAGVAVVNPNRIKINPQPPPVHIEEIFIDKKEIENRGNAVEIQPGQNNLEINYTGLSLINSPLVKFRYRLEGLETDWNEVGTRRAAFYNNLPPGEYEFRVLAANRDGVWNMQGATVKIVMLPFYYQTRWFKVLAGLITAGIIGLVFYNRFSHLRKIAEAKTEFSRKLIASQEAERKRIAAELHDGLGQSLAIISNRAEMGQNRRGEPEIVAREFAEISNNALEALDEVQVITNKLHPHYLERLGLTKALKAMFAKISDVVELDCEIDSVDNLFPKEAEINVYRIVQESLNNVIKHSDAAEAVIKIKKAENQVVISIKDDGRGFDTNNVKSNGGGLGLSGLRERTNMLGGAISINSSIGNGTEIKVILPVKNSL
jgi:signal transduction histidine kinase/ligand-binding sensor domain-containing protein